MPLLHTHTYSVRHFCWICEWGTRALPCATWIQQPHDWTGLGQLLGVPNSNQEPESLGFPIFSISGYTGIGGPTAIPTIRYENTFNPLPTSPRCWAGTHSNGAPAWFGARLSTSRIIRGTAHILSTAPSTTIRIPPAIRATQWQAFCSGCLVRSLRLFSWLGPERVFWNSVHTWR